jgi:hypothetical protein
MIMLPGVNFPWKFSLNLSKFCQARINVFLFQFLPFWVSRWYLSKVGKIYYFFKGREKGLIQATIRPGRTRPPRKGWAKSRPAPQRRRQGGRFSPPHILCLLYWD